MVVKHFDKSLLELKNETVRVAASNYYGDSERASVQLLFGNGTRLRADYWRVTKDGSASISSFDHEQKYGLAAPIDAVEELKSRLGDKVLIDVRLDKETGDLLFRFLTESISTCSTSQAMRFGKSTFLMAQGNTPTSPNEPGECFF